jgi:hypothetical protein
MRAGRLYDVRKLRTTNWLIHAPCAIRDVQEDAKSVRFAVDGWGTRPYTVLVSGVTTRPAQITARKPIGRTGSSSPAEEVEFQFHPQNLLTIPLEGVTYVQIQMNSRD